MNDSKKIIVFFFGLLIAVHAGIFALTTQLTKRPRNKNIISSSVPSDELENALSSSLSTHLALPSDLQTQLAPPAKPVQPVAPSAAPAVAQPTSTPAQTPKPVAPAVVVQQRPLVIEESPTQIPAELLKEQPPITPAVVEKMTPQTTQEDDDTVEFNFENASLQQLLDYIAEIFGYTFITPDIFDPAAPAPNDKKLKGNLITFKTNRALSKEEAWSLFITFIDMAGFAVVPDPQKNVYRVLSLEPAKRSPVPTFIGIAPQRIPHDIANTDQLIRYVYFVENTTVDALKPILDQLKSPTASEIIILREHNAILMIDKAYNIINLMQIVKELDKVSVPQAMSVLKLRRADAGEVKKLYETLIKPEEPTGPNRLFQRKQPTSLYFPENIKIIAEPRSNSLILLGPIDAIKKIEDFVIEYVDVELDKPFSPLFVYPLRYANASNIAKIMNDVTAFGKDTPDLRASGAIRGVDKYFKPMSFTPEEQTNRLIIKGDYEDYLKAVEIIKQLDEPQPQVAVEVLLLSLNVDDLKILGTQMRSKVPCGNNGIFGDNIKFQTSGMFTGVNNSALGIVTAIQGATSQQNSTVTGVQRLLGDLINLVTNAGAGNTIISLGDSLGAWALIQALETITSSQVLANPFLLATNNTPSYVSVGITQRVVASQVLQTGSPAQNTFKDEQANLTVNVTPHINADSMITLDLDIKLENFLGVFDPNFVQKSTRQVVTKTLVADKEVIAIGGLIQNNSSTQQSKVPILGDIPIIGWLFKNKNKEDLKDDLLILIATQIVRPDPDGGLNEFTRRRVNNYEGTVSGLYDASERKDPIYRSFFENKEEDASRFLDDFIFERHREVHTSNRKKRFNKKQAASAPADLPATLQVPPVNEPVPPTNSALSAGVRS